MTRQITRTLQHLTTSTDQRIAITRTLAPAAWASLVLWVSLQFGLDLNHEIAELLGVSMSSVATVAPLVLGGALYLLGRFNPGLLERVLLLVPVRDTAYLTTDLPLRQHPQPLEDNANRRAERGWFDEA